MTIEQLNFSVPQSISLQLRQLGKSSFDVVERDQYRPEKWEIHKNDLNYISPIVQKFVNSLSVGDEVFFINIYENDRRMLKDVFTDDFYLIYSEETFEQFFDMSIFAARRIISNLKGKFLLADFMDWGLLFEFR